VANVAAASGVASCAIDLVCLTMASMKSPLHALEYAGRRGGRLVLDLQYLAGFLAGQPWLCGRETAASYAARVARAALPRELPRALPAERPSGGEIASEWI